MTEDKQLNIFCFKVTGQSSTAVTAAAAADGCSYQAEDAVRTFLQPNASRSESSVMTAWARWHLVRYAS